jgi:hypothetical protein
MLRQDYNENQIKLLQVNHKKRMLDVMQYEFHDYTTTYNDDIELAMERHFDDVYKIFQSVDTWKIMSGWEILLQSILDNNKYLKTYADRDMIINQAMPLVIAIKDASYDFYTKWMTEVINNPKKTLFEIPSMNKLFLSKFFSIWSIDKFTTTLENPITLVDYYSATNSIKYNIRNYDNFPPTIKFDYVKKHDIHVDDARIDGYDVYTKYLSEHDPITEIQEISLQIQNDRGERRGTPAYKIDSNTKVLADKLRQQIASSDDIYYST